MKKIISVLAFLIFALPGLSQITIDSEWDDDGNCWAPCDKPEWSFGTINWAIG